MNSGEIDEVFDKFYEKSWTCINCTLLHSVVVNTNHQDKNWITSALKELISVQTQWRNLNCSLYPNLKSKAISEDIEDNELLSSPRDIAEAFNQYFINSSVRIADSICSNLNPLEFMIFNAQSNLFLHPCAYEEIFIAIKDLKSTASGRNHKACRRSDSWPIVHLL